MKWLHSGGDGEQGWGGCWQKPTLFNTVLLRSEESIVKKKKKKRQGCSSSFTSSAHRFPHNLTSLKNMLTDADWRTGKKWTVKTEILITVSVERIIYHLPSPKSAQNRQHRHKYCIFYATCVQHVDFHALPNRLWVQPHEKFGRPITYISTRFRGNNQMNALRFISSAPIAFLLPVTGFLILLVNYTRAESVVRFRGAELVWI